MLTVNANLPTILLQVTATTMFAIRIVFVTLALASASAGSLPSFDDLFCKSLLDLKVQNCVSEKWFALRLDRTPSNICHVLVKVGTRDCPMSSRQPFD